MKEARDADGGQARLRGMESMDVQFMAQAERTSLFLESGRVHFHGIQIRRTAVS
jgi:hypothetical protein